MTVLGAATVSSGTMPPQPSLARTGYKTYSFLSGNGSIKF
jgi:hypothetical protein